MRKLLLLSLVSVLVATLAAPVTADKGHPKELPFKAMFSGQLEGFFEIEGDRCANYPPNKIPIAVARFEGWGTATHMGRTDISAEHCSYATADTFPEGDGTYGQGRLELVAANGDILFATYTDGESSAESFPIISFVDNFTFDNGETGRFKSASGGGVEMGSVDFTDMSFILQMEGVISYRKR